MFSQRGFSLVELMIAVAIIGILASIAFPMYTDAQLRAKRAEIPANLNAITTAEIAFHAANDRLVVVDDFRPDESPGRKPRPWSGGAFDELGWSPDGEVRASYAVTQTSAESFAAYAIHDIDGDGEVAWWVATPDLRAASISEDDVDSL